MAERETDQSKNSVTATKFSSFSSVEVSKLKEHTHATSDLQADQSDGLYTTKAIQEQKQAIRPRLTLKGPYSGLLTVGTPAKCFQSTCDNFSSYCGHSMDKSDCFNHVDHTDSSSLKQSNVQEQSYNSVTATDFSSMEVSKLKEYTHSTSNLWTESLYDTKVCIARKEFKEQIHKQHDEQKPAIRPKLTLKGPYSGLLTVDNPASCSQSSCYNFSSYSDHGNDESNCFTHIYHTSSSLEKSNVKEKSNNSVAASKLSSSGNIEVKKWKEHTLAATSNIQIKSSYDTKACGPGSQLKEYTQEQPDEQKPVIRPRLSLKGPYSGLFTVDTPAHCLQSSCQNFSSCSDHDNDKSDYFKHIDLTYSSLKQSNIYEQRVAVIRPGTNAEQEEEEASMGDPDSVIKHPLQNSWAMWFFKNDKSRDWKDNLRVITTFDTVEDFWGLYNHTLPASKLQSGCDYSVFKAGIQPMWEDAQNKKGGRWLINLNKSQRQPHLDDLWLETLLCLIGEGFDEYSDDICGATVNIRTKGDKLGLWTRDASRNDATRKIGMKLKESLNVPPKIVIGFQAHSDTAGKAGSTVKNRFTV